MNVSFQGFQEQVLTFETAESLAAGVPVKISANGIVAACADGEYPIGITRGTPRGGIVAVQVSGYARVKYSGDTAPALGGATICAGASGTIKPTNAVVVETGALAGRTVLVVEQDTAGTTVGVIL